MFSLIEYFKCKQLTMNITSSRPYSSRVAENALEKNDDKYFETQSDPYFWQIEFPRAVTIESYTLSSPSSWSMSVWEVSFSLDNTNFSSLPSFSSNLVRNKNRFLLPFPIYCKYFKITSLLSTYSNQYSHRFIRFNSFDCFGSLGKKLIRVKNQCSLSFARTINNFLLSAMIMTHLST